MLKCTQTNVFYLRRRLSHCEKKNTTQTFLKEISDLITSQVYIFLCLLCSAFFSPFPVDTHTQTNSYEKYFLVCVRATHSLQSTYISRCSVLAAFISPFIFWFFHWWAAPVVSRYLKHTHTHTAHRPRIGPVVRVYVCVYAGMHFRISVPTSILFMQHIYENTHTMKMGIVPQHSKRTSQRHTNICINIICSYILVDCCEKFRVFFIYFCRAERRPLQWRLSLVQWWPRQPTEHPPNIK